MDNRRFLSRNSRNGSVSEEEGCQVVEMECSALAACAKFRKVTWAMLLFSADTLADPHKYQEREWGKNKYIHSLRISLRRCFISC